MAANFEVSPSLAYLPESQTSKLISLLSLDLPLELAGTVCTGILYAVVALDTHGLKLEAYGILGAVPPSACVPVGHR